MSKVTTRLMRGRLMLAIAALTLLSSIPARTAITTPGATTVFFGSGAVWDPDVAFDPVSQRFLVVFTYFDQGPWGLFLNSNGQPDGAAFQMLSPGAYGQFPRVAARTGGAGGFLVTYYIGGIKQAIYVRPGVPTILAGPLTLDSNVLYERDGGGLVYVPEYDKFLVTYPKGRHTWMVSVGGLTGNSADLNVSPPAGVTELTGDCTGEYLNRPEIAWDSATDRALVTGWRDFSECSAGGGIWTRIMSFNGTSIAPVSGFSFLIKGGVQYDAKVVWSEAAQRFVVFWVHSPQPGTLAILKTPITTDGAAATIRTILPPNLNNTSPADNAFGGQNQLGVAYNQATGRMLLVARGNDNGITPDAPLYGLELNSVGDAIPFSMVELLPTDAPRPFPGVVARPGTDSFLVLAKAGIPSSSRGELDLMTAIATGNGATGSGVWPTTSGTDLGGGQPPPPPPPSGTYTLSITKPAGGTVVGPNIFCGDFGSACTSVLAANTYVELAQITSDGYVFSGWVGCTTTFTLTSNLTCGATFSPIGGPPPPPPPSGGNVTLSIVRPSGGTILGPEIFCGDGGAACGVTKPAGTTVELVALPSGSNTLTSWGSGCGPVMTLNGNMTCAPTFSGSAPPPPPPPSSGNGPFVLNISKPNGGTILGPSIFCGDMGSACQVTLGKGTYVELAALASAGSTFTGWVSCSTTFTINSDLTCTPSFNGSSPQPPPPPPPSGSYSLSVFNPGAGGGGGFVLGPEMVCNPGSTCTLSFSTPTTVTLFPVPYAGFYFAGWVEAGCANVMTVNSARTCTANFNRF